MTRKSMLHPLFLLCFAALLLLTGCGSGAAVEADGGTPREILEALIRSQTGSPAMITVAMGDDAFAIYLDGCYRIDGEALEDGVIAYADGPFAREFAVLRLKEDADRGEAESALLAYADARIGDFIGYMPDQVRVLEQAVVEGNGRCVALLICEDPEQAAQAFAGSFGAGNASDKESRSAGRAPAAATPEASRRALEVDTEAILTAWQTGDRSALIGKSLQVLEACERVIDEVTDDTMSDYEKELAVHDWIIQWSDYDVEANNRSPSATPHPDNGNPYGLLVARRAICTGYASTFQLFMDMLNIECITVYGTAYTDTNEHAWNQVKLDGEWYAVDITWNDPTDLTGYAPVIQHKFFNVSSDYLRDYEHYWDDTSVPEATAPTYTWSESSAK